MPSKPIERYLERYAASAAMAKAATARIETTHKRYRQALIVPAFDEDDKPLRVLAEQCRNTRTLFILVINCPENADPAARERTRQLLRTVRTDAAFADVCWFDAVSTPLPRREGVGLARKLGTDLALDLYNRRILSSPWFFQTDADATLPRGYFETALPEHASAVVFAHEHVSSDSRLLRAARLYEQHMHYYVAGLRFAGSSYAYPTLGSTIAVNATAYAMVRGYPRRNAGEDFHLLNKLNKISRVVHMPQITVRLAARLSHRVPFGTGPALADISQTLATDDSGEAYLSYHPQVFCMLRRTLAALHAYEREGIDSFHPQDAEILHRLGWSRVRAAFRLGRSGAVHEWFDGLKSLRFVHEASHIIPRVSLLETLQGKNGLFFKTERDTGILQVSEHSHEYSRDKRLFTSDNV